MVSCFLPSRPLCSLPGPCWQRVHISPPASPSMATWPACGKAEGGMNLQAVEGGWIFIAMIQKLKSRDSPHSSRRRELSLNRRGITETRERKTNLQRRNFTSMTPLIIHFLIRKSSLMRHFRQLIGLSISMRTILAQRIRGLIAHQTQISPRCPISFANNAGSRAQRKPFPGILRVAPRADWKARVLLCLKKQCPTLNSPPTAPTSPTTRT